MDSTFHQLLLWIQHGISLIGILIILSGVLLAIYNLGVAILKQKIGTPDINGIRASLGRFLILGLEFIVASDLIGTTTTPDYYALGLAAIIVCIRTLLSYSLNRELIALRKE